MGLGYFRPGYSIAALTVGFRNALRPGDNADPRCRELDRLDRGMERDLP